jgi:hypothetical protein
MLRLLILVAIVAGLAGVYDSVGADAGVDAARVMMTGGLAVDIRSFAMGFASALILATFQRFHWHELRMRMRQWLVGGMRLFQFVALAALLIGVLMYY